ncbi:MAG: tau 95 subunit of transcription factor TFIIIC [Cirrosporium novae-zelandiae]|nr:MAG: tau 95 subunit of transcription factor TFIIIC [Cirrosporium novae-zelandiae]
MDSNTNPFVAKSSLPRQNIQEAPWLPVPSKSIVSVEHPCIIKNVDKGIQTLGGSSKLAQTIRAEGKNIPLNLYLHPGDRTSKPILGTNIKSNSVLLKITVPKRTGRKRKRGSSEPFSACPQDETSTNGTSIGSRTDLPFELHDLKIGPTARAGSNLDKDAKYLLRSIRDNKDKYHMEAVGTVSQTHRFRDIPDFIYSTANSPFMRQIKEKILPCDYSKLKEWILDPSKGPKPQIDLIPPPSLSHVTVPFNYGYHQNPSVKHTLDSAGRLITINTQAPMKIRTQQITSRVEMVPTSPPQECAPIEVLEPGLQDTISNLRPLLDRRPIWTRRALLNTLANVLKEEPNYMYFRQAIQYVGYIFRSGPWRDVIVRFGVDPRKDPQYRIYQTIMFQVDPKKGADNDSTGPNNAKKWEDGRRRIRGEPKHTNGHIFDGQTVDVNGRTWQVCDVIEPILSKVISVDQIRTTCDLTNDGWFLNGTWAKFRTIMKAQITRLMDLTTPIYLNGRTVPNGTYGIYSFSTATTEIDDADLMLNNAIVKIANLPEEITSAADASERGKFFLGPGQTKLEQSLASEVRRLAVESFKRGDGMRGSVRVADEDGGGEGDRDLDDLVEDEEDSGETATATEVEGEPQQVDGRVKELMQELEQILDIPQDPNPGTSKT